METIKSRLSLERFVCKKLPENSLNWNIINSMIELREVIGLSVHAHIADDRPFFMRKGAQCFLAMKMVGPKLSFDTSDNKFSCEDVLFNTTAKEHKHLISRKLTSAMSIGLKKESKVSLDLETKNSFNTSSVDNSLRDFSETSYFESLRVATGLLASEYKLSTLIVYIGAKSISGIELYNCVVKENNSKGF